jgi:ferrous iron transport protein B
MILVLIFYISIKGANYPSDLLFKLFELIGANLRNFLMNIHMPRFIYKPLMDGIYCVLTWVIAVMLPPMAIFFPLFTILEDLGVLPRIAFNLDGYFNKSKDCGKQALTMMMGFGCNAVGVEGARIIDSPRERLIAILTNSFVPCNGRFPFLITIAMIFTCGIFGNRYYCIIFFILHCAFCSSTWNFYDTFNYKNTF